MIPVVLGLTAWIAKGVALTALPRLLKAVTACCSPTPKAGPIPSLPRNQAVLQAPDRVIIYRYDNLSQLIGVNINNTPAATFGFDAAGNLQTLTVGNTTTGMTYNALNQRVTPGTNVYDPKGQTTDKDGRTFEWDDDGRMTAIVDGTHRSEFGYDGYGRRIKIAEFDNGVITSKKLYWWLGGEIVTEREGLTAGFPLTKQFFSQGVIANGIKLFYTFDQLGSVRELIDSTGVVRADYRYDTYGKRTKETGDLDSDWGYAGLWHHGPSGLDLATHRTYDSAQGRWISRDPLGEGVDYNLYRYCGNNPIGNIDPTGLDLVSGATQVGLGLYQTARGVGQIGLGLGVTQLDGPEPGPADVYGAGIVASGARGVYNGIRNVIRGASEFQTPRSPTTITVDFETGLGGGAGTGVDLSKLKQPATGGGCDLPCQDIAQKLRDMRKSPARDLKKEQVLLQELIQCAADHGWDPIYLLDPGGVTGSPFGDLDITQ